MIRRTHAVGGRRSAALYSDCGTWRYLLERRWDEGALLNFILLNPSTATEERNDPTIERCERRARRLGFAGLAVTNLFAFRATRPADLRLAPDPGGPGNGAILLATANAAAQVICGWGTHGAWLNRGPQAAADLRAAGVDLWHLGLTKDGHPRHPLYVAGAALPGRWRE